MLKKLLILLVCFLSTAAVAAIKPYPIARIYDVYNAWNMVCFELRDVDCTGIKVPSVKTFSPLPNRKTLLGYYKGGNTIFVRVNLRQKRMEEVLTHEMSHYLDKELKLLHPWYNTNLTRCQSEKRAWAVSDAYNKTYGRYRSIVGKSWTNWYKHCSPYRDVLYPKVVK